MRLEKIAKIQNISENELCNTEKLQSKSIDELGEIARLRGFKKLDDLTKEDLIFRLLKSESNPIERSYFKYFNNSISDDTYDDEIKSKINDIRLILSRLGNIVTKNIEKKLKKNFMKQKKSKTFQIMKKRKRFMIILLNQQILSIKKTNTNVRDHDDEDCFEIKELENLFGDVDNDDYYKPVLVRSSFKKNYEYYENRGGKEKKKDQ